jgi:hypothetical protein
VLQGDQSQINYQGGGSDAFVTIMLQEGALYTSLVNQQRIIANASTVPNVLPTINTVSAVAGEEAGTVVVAGSVQSMGGSLVYQRGFVWSLTESPTLVDSFSIDSGTGMGDFTATLTTGVGTFYVAAYARNSVGTAYGESVLTTVSA